MRTKVKVEVRRREEGELTLYGFNRPNGSIYFVPIAFMTPEELYEVGIVATQEAEPCPCPNSNVPSLTNSHRPGE